MKVISIKKEQILIVLYVLIIIFGLYQNYGREVVSTFAMPISKKVIVIDPGHGGWDPGKVGIDNVLEKNINLSISKKVQAYLQQSGATVILTRTTDEALGDTKNADLKKRNEIVNTNKADVLISIHQNSFPEESVKGPQAFYYNDSTKSKSLAELVQKELITAVDVNSTKKAKANTNYYILKQTSVPAIIVECGFLSNDTERKNLSTDEYQDKVAWAIYKGVIDYFGKDETVNTNTDSK